MRATHGMTGTPEYVSWQSIIQRCTNKNSTRYESYAGRGITVCDEWLKFDAFFKDMGFKPSSDFSIDRIDNDKGYYKENCRWATRSQQQQNKTPYNGENLKRAGEHWTNLNPEKARLVAAENIRKAHGSNEENANAKVTFAMADNVRKTYEENCDMSMTELGAIFGIGRETTRKIVRRLAWVS